MAKVIHHGLLPPDDPIYQSGPVIGGKRFTPPPKPFSPPSKTETEFEGYRYQIELQAEVRLLDRIRGQIAARDEEAFQAVEDAYFDDLTSRRPNISKEEADELQWYRGQKPKPKK